MRVLGIDPGIERCGFSVLEEKDGKIFLVEYGCLYTSKNQDIPGRLLDLDSKISNLFKKFFPQILAIEDLFFNSNAKTAIIVGQARGVIMLAAAKAGITVVSYPPLEIKMAITGYGRSEKREIQQMVKKILRLKEIPKPDDAADALAVALTFCFTSKFKSKIK